MATKPPVSLLLRVRQWVALPLWLMALVTALVATSLLRAGSLIGRMAYRLSGGIKIHIYWVLIQAHRIVAGLPRWKVEDTIHLGMQPRTAADRLVAEADKRLVLMTCGCDNPKCPTKGPRFVANPFVDGIPPGVVLGPGVTVEMLNGKRPPAADDRDPPPPPAAA